jgi:hydrogenase expression/formation protein HypD
MKHQEEYRDPDISKKLIKRINDISRKPVRLMEVCGTHTMSIFRHGIRSVLPDNITLLSGPGCPVCVTSQKDIDAFIELSKEDNTIVATFGDLMRVPGSISSLLKEHTRSRDIRMVYSPSDAVKLAEDNPDKKIIFPGVGFETTIPTIAISIMIAAQKNIDNFFVYSAHKLVPPALEALISNNDTAIDGFILPGHVSVIIGTDAYRPFFEKYNLPCVVTGFEPVDILKGILNLVNQVETGNHSLDNEYKRAVTSEGNKKAAGITDKVFQVCDTIWRGFGIIRNSGLEIKEEYKRYNARVEFDINVPEYEEKKGCRCGEILTGAIIPPDCPLYKKICTPVDPVGPCMVSTEGTCAAYFRFYK